MDAINPTQQFLTEALEPLLGALEIGGEVGNGYALSQLTTGASLELTLTKGAGSFIVWLRNPADETAFFKKSARFLVGYRGDPPDRQGFELIETLLKRITANEAALSDSAYDRIFEPVTG